MPAIGIGFRFDIGEEIETNLPEFDLLEVIVDQYLDATEVERRRIEALTGRIPMVVHGLRLSLGSIEPPDPAYLDRVSQAIERLGARHYSEHLAFTRAEGLEIDVLLPIPLSEAFLDVVTRNVLSVRKRIACPMLIENVPTAFRYADSTMSEAEFLNRLCDRTGIKLLLDIENAYADEENWATNAETLVDSIDVGKVACLHVAGGARRGAEYFDDHAHDVPERVLDLLAVTLVKHDVPTIILERDGGYEGLEALVRDLMRIRSRIVGDQIVGAHAFAK